jgi:hypothetical protein
MVTIACIVASSLLLQQQPPNRANASSSFTLASCSAGVVEYPTLPPDQIDTYGFWGIDYSPQATVNVWQHVAGQRLGNATLTYTIRWEGTTEPPSPSLTWSGNISGNRVGIAYASSMLSVDFSNGSGSGGSMNTDAQNPYSIPSGNTVNFVFDSDDSFSINVEIQGFALSGSSTPVIPPGGGGGGN